MLPVSMNFEFNGNVWYWRGPAPWYFVTIPAEHCRHVKAVANSVTYGWGMIPVVVQIGKTKWQTSLFPKDGLYVLPIKASSEKQESLRKAIQ